jgi:class 3 adenylate cyclase
MTYEHQHSPAGFSSAASSALLPDPSVEQLQRSARPRLLSGQNCTVLLTDVVDFTSLNRTYHDRRIIREALYDMTQSMLNGIADVQSGDRGDGILTVFWPDIPTAMVIDRLVGEMLPALERFNATHCDSTKFQLRAAVHVGPINTDVLGVSGDAINVIARLIEAPLLKRAMRAADVYLGIIVTPFVYDAVIRSYQWSAGYRQVHVKVKKFDGMAWMSVFDKSVSPHGDSLTALAS